MPTTIVEDELELELGDEWSVVKWDDSPSYRNGIQELGDSKAVDVIAFSESRRKLLMLELKDFRGHRIPNKDRIKTRELFIEVGRKARDTIAGVCGAARNRDEPDLSVLAARFASRTPLTVVLWLEEDPGAQDVPTVRLKRDKGRLDTMRQALKGTLRWLTPRVMICSLNGEQLTEHGIVVRPRSQSD